MMFSGRRAHQSSGLDNVRVLCLHTVATSNGYSSRSRHTRSPYRDSKLIPPSPQLTQKPPNCSLRLTLYTMGISTSRITAQDRFPPPSPPPLQTTLQLTYPKQSNPRHEAPTRQTSAIPEKDSDSASSRARDRSRVSLPRRQNEGATRAPPAKVPRTASYEDGPAARNS